MKQAECQKGNLLTLSDETLFVFSLFRSSINFLIYKKKIFTKSRMLSYNNIKQIL